MAVVRFVHVLFDWTAMGESTKSVAALIFIVALITSAFVWFEDRPSETVKILRFSAPAMAVLTLGFLIKLQFRPDLAPDYLREWNGEYFNRGGFCFNFTVMAVEGIAYIDAYFQTQQDRTTRGWIALRPSRGFFLTRARIDTITFYAECPPGGFGFVRYAVPIPKKLQGKRQTFEVGACVDYPEKKGKRVRFRDGIFLRTDTDFSGSFNNALALAGAATGSLVISKPATVQLQLPTDVAEEFSEHPQPKTTLLWKMGDPLLD